MGRGSSIISEKLPFNRAVLKQCREQLGYSLEDVGKKIKGIALFEEGKKRPTFKQLDELAKLYDVPRWVFISEELPPEYRYQQKVSFRRFSKSKVFSSKVRLLVAEVERYRDFFLELREDMEEPVPAFSAREVGTTQEVKKMSEQEVALRTRKWLSITVPLKFEQLREKLEQKSVFVFLTSKFKGNAYIGKGDFRGISLPHEKMPIIIINDSDIKKAQSFTLFHELGHLLRGDPAIDSWEDTDDFEEKWCDNFSGNLLMPREQFEQEVAKWWKKNGERLALDLGVVKNIAKHFQVSAYACSVRLRRVEAISQEQYEELVTELNNPQNSSGFVNRHRNTEIKNQFGKPFIRAVFTAWHDKELSLVQVLRILNCKRVDHVLKIEKELKV